MPEKTVQYLRGALDQTQVFLGPQRSYQCTLTRVTLYHHEGRAAGLELDAHLAADTYRAMRADGACELTDDNQGAILGGSLQADQPVDVTLFLRHDLLKAHFSRLDAFEAEVGAVLDGITRPVSPLARADAWVFVSVMQDVPGESFQVGFKHRAYEELDAHLLL